MFFSVWIILPTSLHPGDFIFVDRVPSKIHGSKKMWIFYDDRHGQSSFQKVKPARLMTSVNAPLLQQPSPIGLLACDLLDLMRDGVLSVVLFSLTWPRTKDSISQMFTGRWPFLFCDSPIPILLIPLHLTVLSLTRLLLLLIMGWRGNMCLRWSVDLWLLFILTFSNQNALNCSKVHGCLSHQAFPSAWICKCSLKH